MVCVWWMSLWLLDSGPNSNTIQVPAPLWRNGIVSWTVKESVWRGVQEGIRREQELGTERGLYQSISVILGRRHLNDVSLSLSLSLSLSVLFLFNDSLSAVACSLAMNGIQSCMPSVPDIVWSTTDVLSWWRQPCHWRRLSLMAAAALTSTLSLTAAAALTSTLSLTAAAALTSTLSLKLTWRTYYSFDDKSFTADDFTRPLKSHVFMSELMTARRCSLICALFTYLICITWLIDFSVCCDGWRMLLSRHM